jgi:crossover junction endodeoxyribonuclease RuvC
VAQMVKMLLGLDAIPKPHDATDALAVAICHIHNGGPAFASATAGKPRAAAKSWRQYRP